jgi:hypothetical protein
MLLVTVTTELLEQSIRRVRRLGRRIHFRRSQQQESHRIGLPDPCREE